MEYRTFLRFYELIPQLQARDKLAGATVAAFPHMTAKARRDLQKQWMADAGMETVSLKRKVGWDQLGGWLRGAPPRVVKVVDGEEIEAED